MSDRRSAARRAAEQTEIAKQIAARKPLQSAQPQSASQPDALREAEDVDDEPGSAVEKPA